MVSVKGVVVFTGVSAGVLRRWLASKNKLVGVEAMPAPQPRLSGSIGGTIPWRRLIGFQTGTDTDSPAGPVEDNQGG